MKGGPCADVELEARFVASVATWPEYATDPTARISPLDMYSPTAGELLADVYRLADTGKAVDPISVLEAAGMRGTASRSAAADMLASDVLLGTVPTAAARLRRLARARRLREQLLVAVAACEAGDADEASRVIGSMQAGRDAAETGPELMTANGTMVRTLEDFVTRLRAAGATGLMRTGYPLIDNATGPLREQTCIVIGGRTGSGKSTLMLGTGLHLARKLGVVTGILSLEDAPTVWGERLLADIGKVSPERIQSGEMSRDELSACERACVEASKFGLHFGFALNRPIADVLLGIRSLHSKGCRVVMVDYLQAVRVNDRNGRHVGYSNAAQDIKGLCQQLGVVLILGSQLARPERGKEHKEPFQSELKESGDIENISEVIALLWKTSDGDDAEALGKIAKIKWSPKRPRFKLERNPDTGALVGLSAVTPARGGSGDGIDPDDYARWGR